MYFAKRNARTIVEFTTAYPFRLPEGFMVCVYCCDSYPDPDEFRKHMNEAHKKFKLNVAFAHVSESFIKVDCTDLRCRICDDQLDNIQTAAEHISAVHGKDINFDYDLGLQPFNVKPWLFLCTICNHKASNLRGLSRHIQKHFYQCTCESCGKSYASGTSLQYHIKHACGVATRQPRCRKCKRSFETQEEIKQHFQDSKMCCIHVCNFCGERFGYWKTKQEHLTVAHGMPSKDYPCPECDMVFNKPNMLRKHFKILHTSDHWTCVSCQRKFDSKFSLDRHMIVHTGEKSFTCHVCSKAFPRKSTLTEHMWIHSEVKRHECKICDKQFNQRISWKTHMKTRHPELDDI